MGLHHVLLTTLFTLAAYSVGQAADVGQRAPSARFGVGVAVEPVLDVRGARKQVRTGEA